MIDITQEVFSGCVYPGDTKPTFRRASSLEAGDACTLTDFSMCAHNGTHLDAPRRQHAQSVGIEVLGPEDNRRPQGRELIAVCDGRRGLFHVEQRAARLPFESDREDHPQRIAAEHAPPLRGGSLPRIVILGAGGSARTQRTDQHQCRAPRPPYHPPAFLALYPALTSRSTTRSRKSP